MSSESSSGVPYMSYIVHVINITGIALLVYFYSIRVWLSKKRCK